MPELLRGQLGPIRLASVLQLVEAELLTARVVMDAGNVAFFRGKVISAHSGKLTGMLALYELFINETGEFSLKVEDIADAPAIGPMLALVIEGCRLADEWARIAPLVLRPVGQITTSNEGEATLLARLDGGRTVEQALRGAKTPIIDFVLQACERGLLHEVPPEGRPARAPTPAPAPTRERGPQSPAAPIDYDTCMDLGRRHTRESRWDLAVRAFEEALVARPSDRIALQNLRRAEQAREGRIDRSAFQWFRRA